jgi:hypothetical protein
MGMDAGQAAPGESGQGSPLPGVDRAAGSTPSGAGAAPCVTLEAEVPEVLFLGMRSFLENHPQWDQYSVITSALAGFLFQNGCQDRTVTQHYLDGLFLRP